MRFTCDGRGARANPARDLDLYDIGCIHIDSLSYDELRGMVERTLECSGWAIMMLHGIGADTQSLYLDEGVHARFVAWLADQQSVWTAPVRTIARYLKESLPGS